MPPAAAMFTDTYQALTANVSTQTLHSEEENLAGLTLDRWLFSWLCGWFPGRVPGRRRPVVRSFRPMLTILEDRWSPTSLNGMSTAELAPSPHNTQINSAMAQTAGETRKSDEWAAITPSESITLLSTSRQAEENSTLAQTPIDQPAAQTSTTALDSLVPRLSSQSFSPLSTPPKQPAIPQASYANGGGAGAGGRSTPNAGMGGGGPTGGGGPGVVNANQFVGVDFGTGNNTVAPAKGINAASLSRDPKGSATENASPLTAFQTTYSTTAPAQSTPLKIEPMSVSLPNGRHGTDPMNVLDLNSGETIPANVTLNTFSTWGENLLAQVSGGTVSSYAWNVSQAPDLTNVTGTSTAQLQGTWKSFTSTTGPRTDIISVTETPQVGSPITVTMTFAVAGTNSPAYSSTRPTSSSTWPTVITPDKVSSGQATQAAGPYASMGLADGSVQTSFAMPSYNPNTAPVSLDYNSTTANAQPIFLTEYQLPFGQSVPSTITARLTFNGTALASVTYNTSGLNPGDIMQIGLQANATSDATGRYPYSISVTNGSTQTTYSGNAVIVNQASSPFGPGWSLDNVEQLVPVSGGVILVEPGGTSLWFASNGSGYTTPAGDFSTLTFSNNVYTRTMPDGTKLYFNSSGQETSSVDRDGNTTSFAYSSGLLTSITDMNNQVTTLTYTSGKLTSIEDPALRTATLAYTGSQLTSITDPAVDLWQYTYDGSNNLTKLDDPNNHATSFVYNSAGRVSSVTQADSTTLQLIAMQMNGWAAAGSSNVTAVLLAAGDTALYTDARSNVWSTGLDWLGFGQDVQDADPLGDTSLIYRDTNGLAWMSSDQLARRTRDFYNSQGAPTEIVQPDDSYSLYSNYNQFNEPGQYTDPTGATTSYTYDSMGNMTQKEDALLHTWTYTYNNQGLVLTAEDPLLNVTTNVYNSVNELTSQTNALNQTTTNVYNSAGQRTSVTDARGFTNTYSYDAMNRMTGETLADTSTTSSVYTYTYDNVGNETSVTDPLDHTTTDVYNAVNERVSETNALNETTTFGYDANGNETSVTNPLNQTETYTYDAANRQTAVTNALNQTTTTVYDAAGEQSSVTDPLNHTTTKTYTALGQVASTTDPVGDVTAYTYDSVGDETSINQGGPSSPTITASMVYNADHEEVNYIDATGNTYTYTYDADGNSIGTTDPNGHSSTNTYNAINQLISAEDPLGNVTSYGYDADGNQTTVTNPLNQTNTETYDAQGRVLTVTSPVNGTTTNTYDLAGNLKTVDDPDGNITTYTYDAANELTSVANPMGFTSSNYYDAGGELTTMTDANGRTLTYSYDAVGRKTGETWVGGNYTATWTYDAAGNLKTAQDSYSSYSYGYDAANRLTTVDNSGTPGVPHVILTYSYDVYNNRIGLTDNMSGSVSFGYDNDQRLTSLDLRSGRSNTLDAQVTLGYDGVGNLTGITRSVGDTIVTTLSYDNADRLTNMLTKDTSKNLTLANYTYGYNTGSQLNSYQDNNNTSLSYTYVNNGELTGASGTLLGSSYSVAYSYDANGNRNMTGYQTGPGNELKTDGTYSYTYDNNGNTTSQTKISTGYVTYYSWDYENRLTEVKAEDNHGNVLNDEKFTYDVNGNRIGVSLNGTQQLYTVYDGSNPYMDFNGSGTLTERYLTNPQGLSQFYGEVSGSGTTQWFMTDNIGSIRQVVSTSGSVLDAITYDPFGNLVSQTNATNAPRYLYTGAAYDSISGTYLDGAREDNPVDGRWLSQDPLGLTPDTNAYRYVANNPASVSDPTGLHVHWPEKRLIRWKIDKWTVKYLEGPSEGKTIDMAKLKPGDVVDVAPGHVGMYAEVTVTNYMPKEPEYTIEADLGLTIQIWDPSLGWYADGVSVSDKVTIPGGGSEEPIYGEPLRLTFQPSYIRRKERFRFVLSIMAKLASQKGAMNAIVALVTHPIRLVKQLP